MQTRFHLFESGDITTVRQSVKLSYRRWYRLFNRITNRSVQFQITSALRCLKEVVVVRVE
jgi:hypothetical protein